MGSDVYCFVCIVPFCRLQRSDGLSERHVRLDIKVSMVTSDLCALPSLLNCVPLSMVVYESAILLETGFYLLWSTV